MLRKKNKEGWSSYINEVASTIRSTINATTKMTPHYILFGCEKRMNVDLMLGTVADEYVYDQNMKERIQKRFQLVKEFAQESQLKQKLNYDKRRTPDKFNIGDLVLQKVEKKIGKFGWIKSGPYKIIGKSGTGAYLLKNIESGLIDEEGISAEKLSLFKFRKEFDDEIEHMEYESDNERREQKKIIEDDSSGDESVVNWNIPEANVDPNPKLENKDVEVKLSPKIEHKQIEVKTPSKSEVFEHLEIPKDKIDTPPSPLKTNLQKSVKTRRAALREQEETKVTKRTKDSETKHYRNMLDAAEKKNKRKKN